MGFFCVDNLPPSLLPQFAEMCSQSDQLRRVALVMDIRGGEFFDEITNSLRALEEMGFVYHILFLEAGDETLVRRFKETRRRHPLAPHGRVLEGIHQERRLLEELRGHAHRIIDTTDLPPQKLRDELQQVFGVGEGLARLIISVVSFGFKHGLPLDADLVFDVRFMPNPFYVESLRNLAGTDVEVERYILKWPLAQRFLRKLYGFIEFMLPHFVTEGKSQLTIAVGCTGGRHRSVVIAGRLGAKLRESGHKVIVEHRDQDKPRVEA
jgi:UPF0042 nucleotide-binding protein